MTGLSCL